MSSRLYTGFGPLRLGHLREWVVGWLPQSVFSLGDGLSSVEVWFSTALDIEEVLSGTGGDQLHVMVADVIKSFDGVDRTILGRWVCLTGLEGHTFLVIVGFDSGLSSLLVLESLGVGYPKVLLSMVFIVVQIR